MAVVAALALALAAVQLASDAIFGSAAVPGSVPTRVPLSAGISIYRAIARVAPGPYVYDMLARAEVERGDLGAAQRYAQQLPGSPARSELLGRIAQARGDHRAAQRYFVAAGDVLAIDGEVQQLARRDLQAAYALESLLKSRLEQGGTHPDAVAEAYWRLGVLLALQGRTRQAMENYARSVALSPISGKYLIAAGFQAYDLHQDAQAQQYFQRAMSVDPGSADAYAGAGMVALRLGDRNAARMYAARAREHDPASHALKTLQAQLIK